jgi:hypothetical protein
MSTEHEPQATTAFHWLSPPASSDVDDPEVQITCRTKSTLPLTPDILSEVDDLSVIDGQTIQVGFTLNPNHRLVPGQAPSSCPASVDDVLWVSDRSMDLFEVDFVDKPGNAAQNRIVADLKFQRFGVPIVFAFRIKYREGPATPRVPKKVVVLATIMPGSRHVGVAKG